MPWFAARRLACARPALAALIAAALLALSAPGASAAIAGPLAPARLFVTSDEWSLVLSRLTVKAGPLIVQFHNRGEDEHDLRLRRIGARGAAVGGTQSVAATPSDDLTEAELKLRKGRWRLWCSLPGHRQAGMRATLRAK